jgi:hypothetical protein
VTSDISVSADQALDVDEQAVCIDPIADPFRLHSSSASEPNKPLHAIPINAAHER